MNKRSRRILFTCIATLPASLVAEIASASLPDPAQESLRLSPHIRQLGVPPYPEYPAEPEEAQPDNSTDQVHKRIDEWSFCTHKGQNFVFPLYISLPAQAFDVPGMYEALAGMSDIAANDFPDELLLLIMADFDQFSERYLHPLKNRRHSPQQVARHMERVIDQYLKTRTSYTMEYGGDKKLVIDLSEMRMFVNGPVTTVPICDSGPTDFIIMQPEDNRHNRP